MTLLKSMFVELWSLFVDDGSLAAQALALVVLVSVLVKAVGVAPFAAGALLLVGCLAILALSLRRAARRK